MDQLFFDWDETKNRININKHGISFEEASSAFFDEYALYKEDEEHSVEEERFLLLGMTEFQHLVVVCHCMRESETILRIISARKATHSETEQYYRYGKGEKI